MLKLCIFLLLKIFSNSFRFYVLIAFLRYIDFGFLFALESLIPLSTDLILFEDFLGWILYRVMYILKKISSKLSLSKCDVALAPNKNHGKGRKLETKGRELEREEGGQWVI